MVLMLDSEGSVMKLGLIAVAALAVVATGAARTSTHAKAAACGEQRYFGHISSMSKTRLRFDPAWSFTGLTANTAAGYVVPNDVLVVDESHRLYTFRVSAGAHVTVLTAKHYVDGEPVSVATLVELVAGKHPVKLFEPLSSGFWITVKNDTACAFAQQYKP